MDSDSLKHSSGDSYVTESEYDHSHQFRKEHTPNLIRQEETIQLVVSTSRRDSPFTMISGHSRKTGSEECEEVESILNNIKHSLEAI